jgi:hypothetical protein
VEVRDWKSAPRPPQHMPGQKGAAN